MKSRRESETAQVRAVFRNIPWWILGVLLVAALGAWHMKNVRAGVLESKDTFLYSWYNLLIVCSVIVTGAAGWLFFRKKAALEMVFAVCVLALGSMYLAVLAPLSAPDEVSHFITAYRLANTIMGQPAADENGHVYIRTQDAFVLDTDLAPGESLAAQEESKDTQVLGQTLTEHTYRKIHDTGL